MVFKTINDLNNDIVLNISKFTGFDIVVGIPRSGMIVASIISVYINKPLTDIDGFCDRKVGCAGSTKMHEGWKTDFNEITEVLVVEDSVNSGKSLIDAKEKLTEKFPNINFQFLGAYVTNEAKKLVDYYFGICEHPRVFEWNYMHNSWLKNACVDIDGVLCEDPTNQENDDSIKYIDFIGNAIPKMIPSQKIGWIVTSRLEKYRNQTEDWLNKNNIKYDHLIMMNIATAEERRMLSNHGEFKAAVFKKEKTATWFVESNQEQAKTIAGITGKLVYCVENQRIYGQDGRINTINTKKNLLKKKIKRLLPRKVILLLKKMRIQEK